MSKSKNVDMAVNLEAIQGNWPLLRKERNWGSMGLTGVALSSGVAAWSYSIGGYVAYYLNATMGMIAMIAGSLIGMLFVILATIPASAKYGIETIVASKPQFGTRGTFFSIFIQYASIIGWNCLLLILFGRAVSQVLVSTNVIAESSQSMVSILSSLASIAISWFLLRGGAAAIRNYSFVIAIIVAVITIWMMISLINGFGLKAILNAKPSAPSESLLWNYSAGFEILVASVLSWWPYMGSIIRMVPSAKKTMWPAMFAMGLPTGVVSLVGLFSALVTGNYDPTQWFVEIGGIGMGIAALVFLGLANIGTAIVGVYATGIGIRQLGFFQRKISWSLTTLIILLPVALISALIPDLFMERIPTFLAFLGVIFAPVIGIQIADHLFLRRQNIDIKGLYDNSSGSPYYFWGGFNIAAVVGVILGFFTYIYLLNPVTFESSKLFAFTSASIPSIVVSGIGYYLVSKWIVIPARKGGYDLKTTKRSELSSNGKSIS